MTVKDLLNTIDNDIYSVWIDERNGINSSMLYTELNDYSPCSIRTIDINKIPNWILSMTVLSFEIDYRIESIYGSDCTIYSLHIDVIDKE